MPKLMINYPHLASQVFGVPLYVTQEVLAGIGRASVRASV